MNGIGLINELNEIKNNIQTLTDKMELLQKKIEEEDDRKEWWIPKKGDGYCYIGSDGYVERILNEDKNIDKCKINNLNYFQTEQQAERQSFEQLLHRKLKKFALENNSEVDWSNDDSKYNIWYDYQEKKLDIGCIEEARDFGQIYFTSEEVAKKAIEEFKDELIIYFTSDK